MTRLNKVLEEKKEWADDPFDDSLIGLGCGLLLLLPIWALGAYMTCCGEEIAKKLPRIQEPYRSILTEKVIDLHEIYEFICPDKQEKAIDEYRDYKDSTSHSK